MRLNKFWFGFLLSSSIWMTIITYKYADSFRGYNATGGEFFLLLIPVLIVLWRDWSIEQKYNKNKKNEVKWNGKTKRHQRRIS